MTQPTKVELEHMGDNPPVPWVVNLLQRVPIYIVAFACAYYLYQDNKSLNSQLVMNLIAANAETMKMVTKNGEIVLANTNALKQLSDQIDEGHRHLSTMDKVVSDLTSTIHRVDDKLDKLPKQ